MLVEIFNALLWVLSVLMFWELSVEAVIYTCMAAVVSSTLICIFFIDLEHMLIFNRFTITVAICGLVAAGLNTERWYDHLIGAAAGAIVFFAIYYGSILIIKREGLGFGDVKLAAAAGLLLGWQRFLLAMLIASVVGSVILMLLRHLRKDEHEKEYPFAPFIVAGMLFALFFGDPVINWYLGLIFG
jgi:prepilin signal peptidase PulO-like enzyme (type II secretory pathway)